MEFLECPICEFLMCEPVTVPCGHSFCRRCVGTCLSTRCPECNEKLRLKDVKNIGNNVLLFSVIEKCCPEDVQLKCRLRERLKACEFTQALRIVDEGLDIYPQDVSLKLCRAEVCVALQRFSEALRDLEAVCCLRPSWPEGFFRKGRVLQALGRPADALAQLQRCLQLQGDFTPAHRELRKILAAEGWEVPEDTPGLLQVVSGYLGDPSCPGTSSGAPPHGESSPVSAAQEGEADRQERTEQGEVNQSSSAECCLSLCQAVSFLPIAEEDEELMMSKEEPGMTGSGLSNPAL